MTSEPLRNTLFGRPMGTPAWTVSALLLAVADTLHARFGACTVRGEIVAFTRAASGHCYFSLKDGDGAAALRCAMFRRSAVLLGFAPRDGQQVELRGRLTVYEARGELQLVVESMQPVGDGSLYEQFLRLKARLEAEGLFDSARKRPLPTHPVRLGVITSLGAAALRDVLTTLSRRAPHVAVIVYPSPVQGADAPPALAGCISLAGRRGEVDAVILCRGGGSAEDLWAFNDERVVRAIAASPLPVVCGVGHETDVTLSDFAADVRAATPTAAAELAAPSRQELIDELATLAARMRRALRRLLDSRAQRLDQRALQLLRPAAAVARHRQVLDALDRRRAQLLRHAISRGREVPFVLATRLQRSLAVAMAHRRVELERVQGRLDALDPRRVLARGYAWVTDASDRAITSAHAIEPGQQVRAVWADGVATARILDVEQLPRPGDAQG